MCVCMYVCIYNKSIKTKNATVSASSYMLQISTQNRINCVTHKTKDVTQDLNSEPSCRGVEHVRVLTSSALRTRTVHRGTLGDTLFVCL